MDVKTKFNIGDTIHVISGNAVADIQVEAIVITNDGISYRGETFRSFPEETSFASRQELLGYIIGNTDNK